MQGHQHPELRPPLRPGTKVIAVLFVLGVWAAGALLVVRSSGPRIYPDSAGYIDCARSITRGDGFLTRQYGGVAPELWEPLRHWPPGYPIAIATGMGLGLSPYQSALGTSIICSALIVIGMALLYLRFLPVPVAALAALVAVTMPPFLKASTMCLSGA